MTNIIWYVRHKNPNVKLEEDGWSYDGPFHSEGEAKAHIKRCGYVPYGIEHEFYSVNLNLDLEEEE